MGGWAAVNGEVSTSDPLYGKVAIVTGGGRGIGQGIAIALAQAGAAVVVVDRDAANAASTAAEIQANGGTCVAKTCDVSDRSGASEVVSSVVAEFGHLDILVNNAQALRPMIPLAECTPDDLALTLDSGVWGTFHFMQLCYPHMAGHGGSIVNLGSSAGTHGQVGLGAYAAAKEAIRGLSRVAALEWGKVGITVNVICPAVITPAAQEWAEANPAEYQGFLSRRAVPRDGDAVGDIGAAVVFLAGPGATFITGETIMVNGGGTMRP
jgi:NAD(P)-dependent dehydrogenase (short-subunit alcohol dehydrogenase family)